MFQYIVSPTECRQRTADGLNDTGTAFRAIIRRHARQYARARAERHVTICDDTYTPVETITL